MVLVVCQLRVCGQLSAPGQLPLLIVYITWLSSAILTSPQSEAKKGEKYKAQLNCCEKSIVWGVFERFSLYIYATCFPLRRTAFVAVTWPMKSSLEMWMIIPFGLMPVYRLPAWLLLCSKIFFFFYCYCYFQWHILGLSKVILVKDHNSYDIYTRPTLESINPGKHCTFFSSQFHEPALVNIMMNSGTEDHHNL